MEETKDILPQYGFEADDIFKKALADKIVKIIGRIPENLEQINIKSTKNSFELYWKEKNDK